MCAAETNKEFILREPRAGDFGWMVTRHAVLYAQEYQWTENFEGLCAQIVAEFLNNFDPHYERAWIAERDGEPVGSMLLAKETPEVARLRLLLVEPSARGLGIGTALTDACIGFARQCGYRRITLWTHRVLTAARHVYERAGFRLTSSEARQSWGQDVVSEYWDMELCVERAIAQTRRTRVTRSSASLLQPIGDHRVGISSSDWPGCGPCGGPADRCAPPSASRAPSAGRCPAPAPGRRACR